VRNNGFINLLPRLNGDETSKIFVWALMLVLGLRHSHLKMLCGLLA